MHISLDNFSELREKYPILKHPKMCLVPWWCSVAEYNATHVCCFHRFISFKEFPTWKFGPFVTKNIYEWWNCPEMVEGRERMLEKKGRVACNNCPCPSNLSSCETNVLSQLNSLKNRFGKGNADKILRDIVGGKTVLDHPPLFMSVIPTTFCKNNCAFCWQPKLGLHGSDEILENVKANANQCRQVSMVGGELFDLPDDKLSLLLEGISDDVLIDVVSNGLNLTVEKYKKWVIEGPVKSICVSLTAMDAHIFLSGNVSDGLFRFFENMEKIYQLEKDHKIHQFICLVTRSVIPHMAKVVDYADKYGIPRIIFRSLRPSIMIKRGLFSEDVEGAGFTSDVYFQFQEHVRRVKVKQAYSNIEVVGLDGILETMEKNYRDSPYHGSLHDVLLGKIKYKDPHSGKIVMNGDAIRNNGVELQAWSNWLSTTPRLKI